MNKEDHPASPDAKTAHPTFREAFLFWLKLGFISFGGPSGQIAIMHAELVERRRWIGEARFLHALNFCMLLPGPEAQQLAIYIGWLLHKTRGGIAAGVLFVLPSMFILWGLSFAYVTFGHVPSVASVLYCLKPAVLAIVAAAVLRIGRKALKNGAMWTVAGGAFVAIFFLNVSFPAIVAWAGLTGLAGGKFWPEKFVVLRGHAPVGEDTTAIGDEGASAAHTKPSLARAAKVCATCLLLWWTPVLLVGLWLGRDSVPFREGIFFSKAAMVTFGGAYAVLPYVSQQAVENYGWLSGGEMLDGLGLAETTPGPLIMVLQFVGFLGGWHHPPAGLGPLASATLGAAITTWTTFVPCFLWIFLGAPHIEQLRGNAKLTSALSAVTAAVVGVILNLAVWFGLQTIGPAHHPDLFAGVLAAGVFAGMVLWNWGVIPVVLGATLLGLYRGWFLR